ncbi:MAG TPA: hypothetical protein VES19_16950 [Candidatus Limnocylindrales bacterium]|nr:hypothetical protein [Candidatus Limnocylindrales bacterium]
MPWASARLARALLIGTSLLVGSAGVASAADPATSPAAPGAGATLTAQPSVIVATVNPGGRSTATLTLSAGVDLDIEITPLGLGQSPEDGSFSFLEADADASPYSARPHVAVDPAAFQIKAGQSRKVAVQIELPADAVNGERFALLKVQGTPATDGSAIAMGIALGVGVLVQLPGASNQMAGDITGLAAGEPAPDEPILVTGALRNTGNAHYGAAPNTIYQLAVLRDADGQEVASNRQVMVGNSIVPTLSRRFALSLLPSQPLAPAVYTADVEVGLADGTVLDRASVEVDTRNGGQATPPTTATATVDLLGAQVPVAAVAIVLGLSALVVVVALVALAKRRRRGSVA